MTDKVVVLSTCGSEDEARQLARALVESHLAACVQIVPSVQSCYRWEGKIEEAAEWLLVIKSRRDLLDELRTAISKLHSYEVPEVVALAIEGGSPAYLDWLGKALE